MQSSLLDTLFLSEKRKELLLFLKDGTKDSDDIKAAFDFPWKSMIPQIKKLVEWDLISYKNGSCTLTTMGEVIAENMGRFLMTLKTHELYRNYWLEHDLSPIPKKLIYRIGELGYCEILEPKPPDIFKQQEEILRRMNGSDRIMTFISIYHPAQLIILSELVEHGTKLDLIMTEDVYNMVRGDIVPNLSLIQSENSIFSSLKEEYEKELGNLFKDKLSEIFVYRGNLKPLTIIVTDRFLSLTLLDKEGKYNNSSITSSEPSAVLWGEALFTHYKEKSYRLTETERCSIRKIEN
ncbi:winged helix-turn-helix domain-containing protein [Methanolobus mangrovi]|uniref:Winged helix-turn-helix domain-containing protein n=1 Tax=Methanolobus mangrovi TaxID=3072977 RepID=A0AA51UDF6_9EURY|nr:winged helix-turn-helix domain-containing protein [Methanolobus mangrovi]WMW21147.1 winged helix-turn-helix domain-containing protein [Methanolobus mangrovi]